MITAKVVPGGEEITQEGITQVSWYQVQGLWGVLVLVIFAGLYGLGFFLVQIGSYTCLAILSLGLLLLTYLAGLSIGLLYLPAALLLLLGSGLLVYSRYRQEGVS